MKDWREDNLSAILEYPFDFERYIEERLREISDLEERRFAKTVLLEGLGKMIRCTENKYQELERRVYEENEIRDNRYGNVMTIVERERYDPADGTLFPVLAEDLEEKSLAEHLSSEKELFLGTLFLEMDESGVHRFLNPDSVNLIPARQAEYSGIYIWKGEERTAAFPVRPSLRYRDRVELLYQVFQDNHIPWETINTAYLDRFCDVFLDISDLEQGNKPKPGEVTLREAELCIEQGADHVRYDRIPLWNIEWIRFDSADFMAPCVDGIYYEHEFSLTDTEDSDGYLIQSNEDILEIRHEKGRILMKSQKKTFEAWQALHFAQRESERSSDYGAPLLTNRKRDTFFRRYSQSSHVQLMTKTDLFRRIMELDIREYIEVVGYEICENAGDFPAVEGMNWFVRDELFPMESRKVLLLKFEEKEKGCYLNDSMVRFAVSQMQLEIGEYRCVGVIV